MQVLASLCDAKNRSAAQQLSEGGHGKNFGESATALHEFASRPATAMRVDGVEVVAAVTHPGIPMSLSARPRAKRRARLSTTTSFGATA